MPKQSDYRKALAQEMDRQRVRLRLRWTDVATAAGVTTETLRMARKGPGEIRDSTKHGIETALLWAEGSVDAILAGKQPTLLQDELGVQVSTDIGPPLSDLRRGLLALIKRLDEDEIPAALEALAAIVNKRGE